MFRVGGVNSTSPASNGMEPEQRRVAALSSVRPLTRSASGLYATSDTDARESRPG